MTSISGSAVAHGGGIMSIAIPTWCPRQMNLPVVVLWIVTALSVQGSSAAQMEGTPATLPN